MIARVFPVRTSLTPVDEYSFIGDPPLWLPDDIEEVHVSVTFTWDRDEGQRLVGAWKTRLKQEGINADVKIGGPAISVVDGDFVKGRYLIDGVTITSRGCPNKCPHCSVWKREPKFKELSIVSGYIVQDNNLLACSEKHIRSVFDMLKQQRKRPIFSGGIEAKLLKQWHIDLFDSVQPKQIFMAYDDEGDKEPLIKARKLFGNKYTRKILYCYVLIGGPGDTIPKALRRLEFVKSLDICPFAMLYRAEYGESDHHKDKVWCKFQREWTREAIIYAKNKLPSVAVTSPSGDPSGNITHEYEASAKPSPKPLRDFAYSQAVKLNEVLI